MPLFGSSSSRGLRSRDLNSILNNINNNIGSHQQQSHRRHHLRSRRRSTRSSLSPSTREASDRTLSTTDWESSFFLYNSSILINSPLGHVVSSPGMAIFINQAMFFLLCDKVFCPRERLTGLYSLLFYNVASYLISYGKEIVDSRKGYKPYVEVSEQSHVRHLAMSATKIVLDLTKFITFAITCVFIILVFGVPGHNQFNPTWCYIGITVLYYVLTEPWTHANATNWLTWCQVEVFDNLEVLWAPVLIRLCSSFASGTLIAFVWFISSPSSLLLILTSAYVNVYLCLKEMDEYWTALLQQKSCLDRYLYATDSDLENLEGDVCSVCLLPMTQKWKVRKTPCHHFFHSDCLRQCLKQETQICPICKRDLIICC